MGKISVLVLSSLLFFSFLYADKDHDEAYELYRLGEVLSLEEILAITREQQIQGKVLEVELEHEDGQLIYELEILDDDGIVWEIKVDAKDGSIIKQEQDD